MSKRGIVNGIASVALVTSAVGGAMAVSGAMPGGNPEPLTTMAAASTSAELTPQEPMSQAAASTPADVIAAAAVGAAGAREFNAVIPASIADEDDDDEDDDWDHDDRDDDHDGDHDSDHDDDDWDDD